MKKILLYHLYSNGDCLYATVIARQIKNDYKGCHLTWVIASNCKSMIEHNPFVDEIIEIDINSEDDKEAVYNENLSLFNLKKTKGIYDEIYATQIIGDAFSNYDGCLSTSIYRCYGKPNTVGYKPTLILTNYEIKKAHDFVLQNNLEHYKHVILVLVILVHTVIRIIIMKMLLVRDIIRHLKLY